MYILYNKDGSIKKSELTDYIQKGNDGVNSIFLAIEGKTNQQWYATAYFTLPSDDVVPSTPTESTETIDSVEYSGWTISIDSDVTVYEGIDKLSLEIKNLQNQTLFTYLVKLVINPSSIIPDETTITVAQYNQLRNLVFQKTSITNTFYIVPDISDTDLSIFENGQILFDKETKDFYKVVVTEIPPESEDEDPTYDYDYEPYVFNLQDLDIHGELKISENGLILVNPSQIIDENDQTFQSKLNAKLNITIGIVVIEHLSDIVVANYSDGQIFLNKDNGNFYYLDNGYVERLQGLLQVDTDISGDTLLSELITPSIIYYGIPRNICYLVTMKSRRVPPSSIHKTFTFINLLDPTDYYVTSEYTSSTISGVTLADVLIDANKVVLAKKSEIIEKVSFTYNNSTTLQDLFDANLSGKFVDFYREFTPGQLGLMHTTYVYLGTTHEGYCSFVIKDLNHPAYYISDDISRDTPVSVALSQTYRHNY